MSRAAPLLVILAVAACDVPVERINDGPVVVGTDPSDGDVGVDRSTRFRVFFDRQLYPRDVHRGHVRVQSGLRSVFLSAWFEPVERTLHAEIIGSPLDPDVRYRLTVEDLRDLNREPMDEAHQVTFDTGSSLAGSPAPPAIGWDEVAPLLAGCTPEGCHGGDAPALGLDLSSPDGIRTTALGVAAQQTRIGIQNDEVWHGASTLEALAIIDLVGGVGRPARSYLMHKLIGEAHGGPLGGAELSIFSWWIRNGAPTE